MNTYSNVSLFPSRPTVFLKTEKLKEVLVIKMYFTSTGNLKSKVLRAPLLNEHGNSTSRFAVCLPYLDKPQRRESAAYIRSTMLAMNLQGAHHESPQTFQEVKLSENQFVSGDMLLIMP